MALASCLLSTVKNTSGVKKKFGFLGAHGRELDVDEEYTQYGDIVQGVLKEGNSLSKRHSDAFRAALERGDIDIIETPSPFIYDETDDVTRRLELKNGVLYASEACWDASVSSEALTS